MYGKALAVAFAAAILVLIVGTRFVYVETKVVDINEQPLVGHWKKLTKDPCGSHYPMQVEFRASGVFDAPGAQKMGAYWHGGDWNSNSDSYINIQVANDAMVRYRIVEITNQILTLKDDSGCEFTYQRGKS